METRGGSPRAKLLALFDIFDEWFRRDDFEGCLFMDLLLELSDRADRIRVEAAQTRANLRAYIRGLTEQAGAVDPDGLAREWQMLLTGAIVLAEEGDARAAERARGIGLLVLEREGVRA